MVQSVLAARSWCAVRREGLRALAWLLWAALAVGGCGDGDHPVCRSDAGCAKNETCVDGSCKPVACAPLTMECRDGDVWRCNDTGTSAELWVDCQGAEACLESRDINWNCPPNTCAETESALRSCRPTPCVPNQPVCDGELSTTCEPDGSGPAPGGHDCASDGQHCHSGACSERACSPGERLCIGDDVYLCTADGAGVRFFHECEVGTACSAKSASCEPVSSPVCAAGERFCQNGDVYACSRSGAASVVCTVCRGLSEAYGSWNTICAIRATALLTPR